MWHTYKMGFYVSIYMAFPTCEKTGKPYYFGPNLTKIYDLSTIPVVPKQFQRFCYEQGNQHLKLYMRDDHYTDTADNVLHAFPSWAYVERNLSEDAKPYWTEEDHILFHEALKWFARGSNARFIVEWG